MSLTFNPNAEQIVLLITESENLLKKTQAALKEPGRYIDLTCKLMLRDDCSALKKKLKKIRPEKMTEKDVEDLRLTFERLKTTSENILNLYPVQ
ncbi:MAG: hypothetical protein IKV59_08180 [Lachnospiraceae bacterium]|nr:hypothetical protein [Lachnospiraceae bacterium]